MTSEVRTPYLVHCPTHGKVFLTWEEYNRQMNKPNDVWECPICSMRARWDDDNYESFRPGGQYE